MQDSKNLNNKSYNSVDNAITSFLTKGVCYVYEGRSDVKHIHTKALYTFLIRLFLEHNIQLDVTNCIKYGVFDYVYSYQIINLNFKNVS